MNNGVFAKFAGVGFSSDGSCAYVTFSFEDGGEESLSLLSDKYAALVRGRKEFTREEYVEITYHSHLSRAIAFSLRSLSCAPCTRLSMKQKLRKRGFGADIADDTLAYLLEHGYIDEKKQIVADTNSFLSKKYGPLKIKQKLIGKGYSNELVGRVMLKLEGRDFTRACRDVALEHGTGNPFDPKDRERTYAYLTRCGYDSDCIRRVLSILYADV